VRTIAKMIFVYDGKEYNYEMDFGELIKMKYFEVELRG
jgi:hypothetical protein